MRPFRPFVKPRKAPRFSALSLFLIPIGLTGCGPPDVSDPKQSTVDVATSPADGPATPTISLTDAAVAGDVDAVRRHIAAGTDLDTRQPTGGSTALIAAASFGKRETAKQLIDAGADLEAKNNEGSTALHSAAFLCREGIVADLLAAGADRNARNDAGATPLDSVDGTFEEAKPVYDFIAAVLGPYGLKLDYGRIKAARPVVAEMLREK